MKIMKKLEKLTLKELGDSTLVLDIFEADNLKGGYSFAEYESMLADGTWTADYVDGMGYIGATTEPCSAFAGSATCMTFADWSAGNVTGTPDFIAKIILGEIPIVGSAVSAGSDMVSNTRWKINTALLNAGYSGVDPVYFESTTNGYNVYDKNGNLVYSK